MSVTATLVLVALCASAESPEESIRSWRVDGTVLLSAGPPVSNRDTRLQLWAGPRGAWITPVGEDPSGFQFGVDASLIAAAPASEGTPQVSSARLAGGIEGRVLVAPVLLSSTFSSFMPYAFAGLFLGGGVAQISAFDDGHLIPVLTGSLRTGAGLEIILHGLAARLELGVGTRDLRLDVTSAFGLGCAF